jgi:glycine cleavage system H protein
MPVSGKVISFNEQLEQEPELINSDPYGNGWIIKISISDVTDFDSLLNSASYKDLVD